MINKNICESCKKEFVRPYQMKKGLIPRFCSNSCSSRHQQQIKSGFYCASQLKLALLDKIKSNNRYTGVDELREFAKVSSKTFTKFRISVLGLNKECGFRQPTSVFSDYISRYFEKNNIVFELEKTFPTCVSPKEYVLRFDYYLPIYNVLVEADGNQHINPENPMWSEYRQLCDNIKTEWAFNNNIKLIRIPYKRPMNDEYIKKIINLENLQTTTQHKSVNVNV